jgi:hypothetical protein
MPVATRKCFTVDLRGLRAALAARAARDGLTESDVLRRALATALGTNLAALPGPVDDCTVVQLPAPRVKLSARLVRPAANRLDESARAAGLSRGTYLARLIEGAPPVASSADRAALFTALNKSSEELAVMGRDINHLTQLLRQGAGQAAKAYAERHDKLDRDVRSHLALAAAVLAELSTMRSTPGTRRRQP